MNLIDFIPMFIRQDENMRPKGVVTAARWNELWGLAILQGDHSEEAIQTLVAEVLNRYTKLESDALLATKVNTVAGKQLSTEDYTTAEKDKLAGIEPGATNYQHPVNHPPSIITQDADNRFMTDAERAKLAGIEAGATNYQHPATHAPSIIAQDASNRFVTDAEKTTWNGKASFKNGSGTFPAGTTHTVTDAFITADTLVTVSPTGAKTQNWSVVSNAGNFVITAEAAEPSSVTFDWGAVK